MANLTPQLADLSSQLPSALARGVTWLDQHGGAAAFIGIVVAWLVYRGGVSSHRGSVLGALAQELEVHRSWVDHEYPGTERWWEESDARATSTGVFKLSTVAVDAAIANGPTLFLDRDLLPALVGYRQQLAHFNQLVDQAAALQATPEMWRRFPAPRHLIKRLKDLWGMLHDQAVGNAGNGRAYAYFQEVTAALERERRMRVRTVAWGLTGLHLRWPFGWRGLRPPVNP